MEHTTARTWLTRRKYFQHKLHMGTAEHSPRKLGLARSWVSHIYHITQRQRANCCHRRNTILTWGQTDSCCQCLDTHAGDQWLGREETCGWNPCRWLSRTHPGPLWSCRSHYTNRFTPSGVTSEVKQKCLVSNHTHPLITWYRTLCSTL